MIQISGRVVQAGDDEDGQPRLIVHVEREMLRDLGCNPLGSVSVKWENAERPEASMIYVFKCSLCEVLFSDADGRHLWEKHDCGQAAHGKAEFLGTMQFSPNPDATELFHKLQNLRNKCQTKTE